MQKQSSFKKSLIFKLGQLSQRMNRDIGQGLEEFGVTASQWNVLAAIAIEHAATPSAVIDSLDADGAAVSRHLDTLVKKELILRQPSATDRRSVTLTLTEKGQQLVPQLVAAARKVEERYRTRLSEDELEKLDEMLKRFSGEIVQQQHSAADWEIS